MADQDPVTRMLAGFTPASDRIDRDDWLFRAGRASVRPARGWKWACGALLTFQISTIGWYAVRPPEAVTVPVIVYIPQPAELPTLGDAPARDAVLGSPPEAPDRWSYIALARGYDATGSLPPASTSRTDFPRGTATVTAGSRPTWID